MAKKITSAKGAPKTAKAPAKAPAKAHDPDHIKHVKTAASGGDKVVVDSNGGSTLIIPTARFVGDIARAATVGASFAKLEQLWAKANRPGIAKGVNGHNSPHTAKAVADNHAKARGDKLPKAKAAPAPAKGKAKAAPKVTPGEDRKYKVLVKFADTGIRPGTWTTYMVETILAHTSTEAANKASQARRDREFNGKKLDFKWVAEKKKFIQFL